MTVTNEEHRRSVTKSVIWRAMGVLLLVLITHVITGSWITTTLVTVVYHGVFVMGYYLHERFWLWLKYFRDSKWRPVLRIILYEIILGNLVLGFITWILTSNWTQATLITLIYIGNKLWMYAVYDKIWEKVRWGKSERATYETITGR